uniref:EMILIN-2 n=1 Tax=Knipowitschia caucasica TaxID=637954 RepID=A0AAV2L7M1_KNICA
MRSALVFLLAALRTISASHFQYKMFQENYPGPSGSQAHQRNKNWCAYVAQRNVSSVVAGGTESFVQPELVPCPLEAPSCVQQVVYRTHFRPMYKIDYRIVSELEWRCCPGYQGYDCKEVKDMNLLPTDHSASPGHVPLSPGSVMNTDHPWAGDGLFPGHAGHRQTSGRTGSPSPRHLEQEVQHLSQMVLDMQARMTDMASSLRVDFQEDASKMLVSLMNDLRQPASARGGDTQTVQLQDFSFEPETQQTDVMNRISQVTGDLESNTNTLKDLLDWVNRHDGQIHLLMEAAEKSPATPAPGHDLRPYVDQKIRVLREELMEGIDIKMADLKNSCEYKMMSVQELCESQESHYSSLTELMESKESDLREDIEELKSKLEREGRGQSESSAPVLGRVENIERCLNLSEHNLSGRCVALAEEFSGKHSKALEDLQKNMEAKLLLMQDRLGSLLDDTRTQPHVIALDKVSNVTGNTIQDIQNSLKKAETKITAIHEMHQNCQQDLDALKTTIHLQHHKLGDVEKSVLHNNMSFESLTQDLRSVKNEISDCKEKAMEVGKELVDLHGRTVDVESLCSKLEPISNSLQRVKDGLSKHVASLWTCVNQLNGTVRSQGKDLGQLRETGQSLQSHLSQVTKDLHLLSPSAPKDTAAHAARPPPTGPTDDNSVPQMTVMETGEAGPPGRMSVSQLPAGADGSMAPVQGYAGAPAEEKMAFSVGLTLTPFVGDIGIIRFNKVLVNDGGSYDPHTGVFTAPVGGRYLLSAVLAPQRGHRVEAVVSVSNHSVQKLDSSGFSGGPELQGQCNCSSVASLSLVLPLKQGDRVGLVLTAGRLAISASSEVLSTFSAVLLYSTPVQR